MEEEPLLPRQLVSTSINVQARIRTVGAVRANLVSDDWTISLKEPLLEQSGFDSMRARLSFNVTLEKSKSRVLTYLLDQRGIDLLQDVRVRQKRQATHFTGLGEGDAGAVSAVKSVPSGMLKQLDKLLKLDNIMDLAALVQREGERVRSVRNDEKVMMEAMVRRHSGLLNDLGAMLRELPDGMAFLEKLICSEDEQTLRMALSLSERVGQLKLQKQIRAVATNDQLPEDLRQHAFALLMPEQKWLVWKAGSSANTPSGRAADDIARGDR